MCILQTRMASTIKISEVVTKLQCGKCSQILHNPRMLTCKHQFCIRCIDELLEFRPDGSAIIKCPEGCAKVTRLSDGRTTSDLDVDYRVRDIAAMMRQNDPIPATNITDSWLMCESCKENPLSANLVYCTISQKIKCDNCEDCHDNTQPTSTFLPIKFDDRGGRWSVVCSEHGTLVDSLCCGTTFVCLYCRHRKHKDHPTCEPFNQAEKNLNDVLLKKLKFAEDYDSSRATTKEKISETRTAFENILKVNKLKRLEEYLKCLNEEEESLRKDFDQVAREHEKHYVASDSKQYILKCLQMNGLQLLLNKTDIIMVAQSQYRNIREMCVSLSTSHFRDLHPLGRLDVTQGENIAIEESSQSFKGQFEGTDLCNDEPSPTSSDSSNAAKMIRSTFYASPHVRNYIQELGKTVRDKPSGIIREGGKVSESGRKRGSGRSVSFSITTLEKHSEETVEMPAKKSKK